MAEPITSARSQAAMAISAPIHSAKLTLRAVGLVAELRQIALGGHAQLEREALQQDGHQVGGHDDGEQRVAEARAAGDVGGPVAGVHVADRDQESGAEKAQQPPPVVRRAGEADRRMNLRQRGHLVFGAGREAWDMRAGGSRPLRS